MKEKDTRVNMKVSAKARKLVTLLAAFKGVTQSDVIEELADKERELLKLPAVDTNI